MIVLDAMLPGAVNSPETFITNAMDPTNTVITVQSLAGWPSAPFIMVLGGGVSNAETVLVTARASNVLTVERGHQGVAQAWPEGTTAAINFTEGMYRALVDNITTLSKTLPTEAIHQFPITPNDYYGAWELASCEGGIFAPLDEWGFTNATLTTVPSRIAIDINTNTAAVYTIPAYSGRNWNVRELQSGVYILTADDLALILKRR